MNLKAVKALNNNVVLAVDVDSGREVIAAGRGLGFGARTGSPLDEAFIEKTFFFISESGRRQYHRLFEIIDEAVMGLCEEIVGMASARLGVELNEHIHVALPDHIGFAIERLRRGFEIPNPFLPEIQTLYPDEYAVAGDAVRLVEERLGVELPEEERGFLALHFRAARRNEPASSVVRHTSLVRTIIDRIRTELGCPLHEGDVAYVRLVTHIKFALEWMQSGRRISNPLLEKIQTEFPKSWEIAARVMRELSPYPVSDDEIGYLALHLEKIKRYGTSGV